MRYKAAAVEALVAIVDHGTFDAAARVLHVTPSAVSQRIRALEHEIGQVVVRRGTPCLPTDAGAALVRLGRQTLLLDEETRATLEEHGGRVELTVAVNADSLATWFRDVRQRTLPAAARAIYMRGKTAYDEKRWTDAQQAFTSLVELTTKVKPPPEQAAEKRWRELRDRRERQQADRRELRVPGGAVIQVREQQDGEDRDAPYREQQRADIAAARD